VRQDDQLRSYGKSITSIIPKQTFDNVIPGAGHPTFGYPGIVTNVSGGTNFFGNTINQEDNNHNSSINISNNSGQIGSIGHDGNNGSLKQSLTT